MIKTAYIRNTSGVHNVRGDGCYLPVHNAFIPLCLQKFFPNGCDFNNISKSKGGFDFDPSARLYLRCNNQYNSLEFEVAGSRSANEVKVSMELNVDESDTSNRRIMDVVKKQGCCTLSYFDFIFKNGNLCSLNGTIFPVSNSTDDDKCTITIAVDNGILTLKYYGKNKFPHMFKRRNQKNYSGYVKSMTLLQGIDELVDFIDYKVSFDVRGLSLDQLFYMLSNYIKDPSIVLRVIKGTNSYRNKVRKRIKERQKGQQS